MKMTSAAFASALFSVCTLLPLSSAYAENPLGVRKPSGLELRYACEMIIPASGNYEVAEGALKLHFCANPSNGALPYYNIGDEPCETAPRIAGTFSEGTRLILQSNGSVIGRNFEFTSLHLYKHPGQGGGALGVASMHGAQLALNRQRPITLMSLDTAMCDFWVEGAPE